MFSMPLTFCKLSSRIVESFTPPSVYKQHRGKLFYERFAPKKAYILHNKRVLFR